MPADFIACLLAYLRTVSHPTSAKAHSAPKHYEGTDPAQELTDALVMETAADLWMQLIATVQLFFRSFD